MVVTNNEVLGKTVHELGLEQLFGVTVTRITRADLEMTAVPNLRLQFGDVLQVVGHEEAIAKAANLLGNSLKALNETHFVPLFAGIAVGIALGTLPLAVPGLPQPLRLGLAGGPLIVALLVSRLGRIGPLVWHMPPNANLAFREFGIALFFASVGLMAGPQFFATVFSTEGLVWSAAGLGVTVIPIVTVGFFALVVWKMNFVAASGLLAGSMTDPPARAFATNVAGPRHGAVSTRLSVDDAAAHPGGPGVGGDAVRLGGKSQGCISREQPDALLHKSSSIGLGASSKNCGRPA